MRHGPRSNRNLHATARTGWARRHRSSLVAATFLGAVLDRLRHDEGPKRRSFTGFLAWAHAWATSRISARLARDAIAVHTPLRLDRAAADGIVVDHDGETTHRAYMTDAVEHRVVRRLAKADIDSRVRFRAMV